MKRSNKVVRFDLKIDENANTVNMYEELLSTSGESEVMVICENAKKTKKATKSKEETNKKKKKIKSSKCKRQKKGSTKLKEKRCSKRIVQDKPKSPVKKMVKETTNIKWNTKSKKKVIEDAQPEDNAIGSESLNLSQITLTADELNQLFKKYKSDGHFKITPDVLAATTIRRYGTSSADTVPENINYNLNYNPVTLPSRNYQTNVKHCTCGDSYKFKDVNSCTGIKSEQSFATDNDMSVSFLNSVNRYKPTVTDENNRFIDSNSTNNISKVESFSNDMYSTSAGINISVQQKNYSQCFPSETEVHNEEYTYSSFPQYASCTNERNDSSYTNNSYVSTHFWNNIQHSYDRDTNNAALYLSNETYNANYSNLHYLHNPAITNLQHMGTYFNRYCTNLTDNSTNPYMENEIPTDLSMGPTVLNYSNLNVDTNYVPPVYSNILSETHILPHEYDDELSNTNFSTLNNETTFTDY